MLLSLSPNFMVKSIANSVMTRLPPNYNCIHDRSEQDRIEDGGTKTNFAAADNMIMLHLEMIIQLAYSIGKYLTLSLIRIHMH